MVQTNDCLELCFKQIKEYENWIKEQDDKINKNRRRHEHIKLSLTDAEEINIEKIDQKHRLNKSLVYLINDLQKVRAQLSILKQITAKTK